MAYLFRNNWPWTLLAFLIGAILTWFLLNRRTQPPAEAKAKAPVEEKTLVGAGVAAAGTTSAPAAARFEEPAELFDQTLHEPDPSEEETGTDPEPLPDPEPAPEAEPTPQPKPEASGEPALKAAAPLSPEPERKAKGEVPAHPAFSVRMDAGEPTLFDDHESADDVQVTAEPVPAGKYGEGSADAVAHQGPPDGFTIKGNAQSMLFHTPDSPYYGRTKAEVWFRTEPDAEGAGFTKYVRKPRKSTRPRD